MPNIILTDASDPTPVDRTFQLARTDGDFSLFENRATGIYVGYDKLHFRINRPTGQARGGQSRNLKMISTLEMPLLESEVTYVYGPDWTTAPTVSHRPRIEVKFTMPERTTVQERADIVAMFKDLAAEAIFDSFLNDLTIPT